MRSSEETPKPLSIALRNAASRDLLDELAYTNVTSTNEADTLAFVGDLVAKHPDIQRSLDTLDYVRSLHAASVRGNHDQDVLNWRHYIESYTAIGAASDPDNEPTAPDDVPEALKHKWRDEHFKIAKSMSEEAAAWLDGRSLTLHIRSLHAYIVHAGLLPWTIPKNTGKKKQGNKPKANTLQKQLADIDFSNTLGITSETDFLQSSSNGSFTPLNSSSSASTPHADSKLDPEMAILTVKQNRDPYTLLEMRSIKKSGKVTKKSNTGKPWAPIWNVVMAGCDARAQEDHESSEKHKRRQQDGGDSEGAQNQSTQCRPLNVM